MESLVNRLARPLLCVRWHRSFAASAALGAGAILGAACNAPAADSPLPVAPALLTLTAAAGVPAAMTPAPAALGSDAPADAPPSGDVAAAQTVAALTGIPADKLPVDPGAGIQNAPIEGGMDAASDAFRLTQAAQAQGANIADVNELVARQEPLATFTPPPSPPRMDGDLLYVRGGKFFVKGADGSGQRELGLEDRSMPSVWAPPEDPGRAWLSPDGDEVAFFAGTDAAMWRMDIDGRNNRLVLASSLPDEMHDVAVGSDVQRIKLRPGIDYTLIHTPGGGDAFGVLVDNNEHHIRGEARLRVVHAARGAASDRLSVLINGRPAGSPAGYGGSSGEERVTTGAVVIELQDASGQRVALLPSFDVADKEVRTVFVSGDDPLAMIGYAYPSGTRPGSGEARVRVFNAGEAPIDVTIDGDATTLRAIAPGTLSEYATLQGVLSRDGRQDAEIALYGLAVGEDPVVWSPDGEKVAFLAAPDGTLDLFVSAGRGQARPITDDLQRETMPSWSPDSRRLAWMTIDDGFGENRLSVWDGDTVTTLDLAPVRATGQAPSGTRIVYPEGARWLDDERLYFYPIATDATFGIWTADAARGTALQVYDGPVASPEFSPEARAWLFNAGATGELVKLPVDGRATTLSSAAYGARWSPDGRTITYSEGAPLDGSGWRLHAMDADGGNVRALTDRLPIMQESPPVPGPDGKRYWIGDDLIAFTRVGRDYGMRDRQGVLGSAEAGRDIENLYAVDLRGRGSVVQLSDMMKAFYINQVTPSPDGDTLAFIAFSYINRAQQLYTVPRAGGKPVQIDGAVRWFAWMP